MKRQIVQKLFLLSFLFLMISSPLFAQQRGLPPELAPAKSLFNFGDIDGAYSGVLAYLDTHPDGRYTVAANLLAGRCEIRLGKNNEAINRALSIIEALPNSDLMLADSYYLLAVAQQSRGDYYEAARALVNSLNHKPQGEIQEMVMRDLGKLVNGPVAYKAESLRLLARTEGTKRALNILLPKSATIPTIGVLVPESELENDPGTSLIEGAQAAVNKYEVESGNDIDLLIKRVPHGTVRAIDAARTMVRKNGVWGIILGGPESDINAASVETQAAGIPTILPGQHRPTLNAIGPSMIMPEANWYREGEIAATYAVDSLALRCFGIIAPHTDQGVETVAGFLDVLNQRDSIEVLAQEWYYPEESVSLNRQFKRIRHIGFRREFRDRMLADSTLTMEDTLFYDIEIDSLVVGFDSTRYEMLWRAENDSIQRTVEYKTGLVDSNDIELSAFEGLFVPIAPNTIELFAPQSAFYNFRTTKIGNASWHDDDKLYKNRQYVEDLLLTSPYRLDLIDGDMAELQYYLHRETNKTANIWHIRGFDAANIFLASIENGKIGPDEIKVDLMSMDSLNLVTGVQHFGEKDIVGQNMWLFTAKEGIIQLEDAEARRLLITPPEVLPDSLMEIDPSTGEIIDLRELVE
jgi:hypothetical protein